MRYFIILAILLMAGLSFAVNVTGCMNITSSDTYELTTDITGANVSAGPGLNVFNLTCIRVSASDVILDCKGFSITNNGSGSYGVLLEETNADLLTNVTVKNCIISGYNESGLVLHNTTGSLVINNTVSDSMQGIILDISSGNNLTNNTAEENTLTDLTVEADTGEEDCNNIVEDLIGSGGREILYANETVTWSDLEASEVVLCNADGSTLTNITVRGSDTLNNNGILLFLTDDATIQNSNSSNNAAGLALILSNNNTITNNTAYGNAVAFGSLPDVPLLGGFILLGSSDNTFSDNTANENNQFGFGIAEPNHGNRFDWNVACDNNLSGFLLYQGDDTLFSNDIACNNNPENHSVTWPGEDGGEDITLPTGGFTILPTSNTILFNVTAYGNQYAGLFEFQAENGEEERLPTVVTDSNFYGNGMDVIKATVLNESMLLSNTHPVSVVARPLYLFTEENGDLRQHAAVYQIDGTTAPASPPSGYDSFLGRYVYIFPGYETENPEDVFSPIHFQTLTFHWEDTEICGVETAYNETTMVLYTWDGSSWTETPNQFLNIDDNRLTAVNVFNTTEADTYGLFAYELDDPDDCVTPWPPCPPCNNTGGEDDDEDGVINANDLCQDSVLDNIELKPNNYAQNGELGAFESGPNNDQSLVYDMETTKGCTCKQIVYELGAGEGHLKNGCSPSLMENWTGLSSELDRRTGVGKKAGVEGLPATSLLIGTLAGLGVLAFLLEVFVRRRQAR
jgi:parallel beta-helix repeat protein